MKKKFNVTLLVLFSTMLLLAGCGKDADRTDYSDASLWAYCPTTHENEVDVFFVAPTAVGGDSYNMDMTEQKNLDNFLGATNMEKGIYDDKADFYAPYYRQMTLGAASLVQNFFNSLPFSS